MLLVLRPDERLQACVPARREFQCAFAGHAAQRSLSDATWAAAIARFGEPGVVDLIGINGYYALLAMVMNAARTPA